MKYRIKSAYIRSRIDGTMHHVSRRSDGSFYTTNCWFRKLAKGAFGIFVENVR